jgi:hypothetical protein
VVEQVLRDDQYRLAQARRDRLVRTEDNVRAELIRDIGEPEQVGNHAQDPGAASANAGYSSLV